MKIIGLCSRHISGRSRSKNVAGWPFRSVELTLQWESRNSSKLLLVSTDDRWCFNRLTLVIHKKIRIDDSFLFRTKLRYTRANFHELNS